MPTIQIDPEKLARVTRLEKGSHAAPHGHFAACVMEAVAYVTGKPWADPSCADPVITAYAIVINDRAPDEVRQRLLPLIPKIAGAAGSKQLSQRRRWLFADAAIRTFVPLGLEPRYPEHAAKLRALPEVGPTSWEEARAVALAAAEAAYATTDAADAANASANANAANAAYAAYAAADANEAARNKVWDEAIAALERACGLREGA